MKKHPQHDALLADMKNLWVGKTPHEEDFNFFKILAGKKAHFLDCGANSGQSALSFLMNCPDGVVTSFEPNILYESLLSEIRNITGKDQFHYFMLGLSDSDETSKLWIPYVCDQPFFQEATMDITQFEKPWVKERLQSYGGMPKFESIDCKFIRADDLNLTADIIKIDAEGAEMKVLKGMSMLISNCKPIFLIENNDFETVTNYLREYGYEPFQWQQSSLKHMQGASTNCIYLMQSHLKSLKVNLI